MMIRAHKDNCTCVSRVVSRVGNKVHGTRGDSFVEVLVALLVAVLATTLLSTMVMSAMKVTHSNEARLSALHTAESNLASASNTDGSQSVKVVIAGSALTSGLSLDATLYTDDEYARYEAKDSQ